MKAFDNPDEQPGAAVENGTLSYDLLEDISKPRVTETNDYLLDRLLTEFGPPLDLPVHFSYVGEKNAVKVTGANGATAMGGMYG
jgi:hypothetical protein